ncbi:MAG: copper resistance protein CopA, partial [Psychromonas sp.]|nr:copper resistance protein CopA [Psychromonas sp.]
QLQDLFKQLAKTKDKNEIKAILGKIKEHSKKGHQQFRQDC